MKDNKNVLIVGATGATGRLLTAELLNRGHRVKAVVRSPEKLPESVKEHANLSILQASILNLSKAELVSLVADCDAVVSCLGHNLTFRGIFGHPRRLVTEATDRLCMAIKENRPEKPVKFLLMNTSGNRNRDLNEPISLMQRIVIGLLRLLLPPHPDNEQAAEILRIKIGQQDRLIEWVAVRPDGLINESDVSPYEVYPSPIRSAIFNPGQTSRINVGHFMAELIGSDAMWQKWCGQMPVIYNAAPVPETAMAAQEA